MGDLNIGVGTYTCGIVRRGTINTINIGKYCSIAEGVIMDGGFGHHYEFVSTYPFDKSIDPVCKGDINIGNDVWIGEDAMIMSGVTIGDGAVIGARAVVTKDVKPYCIVGGVPAIVIKKRFPMYKIKDLLDIKWWDWDKEKIISEMPLLCSHDINEFINKHKI